MAAIGADFPLVAGLAWLGLARIAAVRVTWPGHHTTTVEHRAQIQPAIASQ